MSRDQRLGGDGDRRQRELLPGAPRTRRVEIVALVFVYEVSEPAEFERVYGPAGEWAEFFRTGRGYVGTELLRDVEQSGRYLVVDRWESGDAYNTFVETHRDEYLRRVDETSFRYVQELRFGTFENVWHEDPATP